MSLVIAIFECIAIGSLWGQEPNPQVSIPENLSDVIASGIQPDLVYLRDENGKFILVPRASYKEFEAFLQSDIAGPNVPSDLTESLDHLQIGITLDGNVARISVHVKVVLDKPTKKWLTIPLGLGSIQVIPNLPQGTGTSSFPPIRVASETPGYVWKLSPSNDTQRQLTFHGVSNINSSPQGQSLRLDLPFVVTDIRMRLPTGNWDLSASGTGSEVVEPFRDVAPYSEAIVRTSGGPIALNWSRKMADDQIQATEVESRTTFSLTSDSNQLRAVSNLAIRGPKPLGGRQFLVHLSPSSTWRDSTPGIIPFQGYRISKVDSANSNVVRIEFEESVSRTESDVNIEWQHPIELKSAEMEFAIPKVEGVESHHGSLDISIPRNILFQWEPQKGIEFIKQTNEGPDSSVYGFKILQQDQPLKATWGTREESAQLKATYQIYHDRGQLLLAGRIDTPNDMRSFSFLQFDVKDWTVDRLQVYPSGKQLESKPRRNTSADQGQLVSIPLSMNDLETGNANSSNSNGLPESGSLPESVNTPDSARDLRSVPRGISFTLSKRVSVETEDVETKDVETKDVETIHFSLPRLSWIDRATDSRKTLTIPGDASVQSWSSILTSDNVSSPIWSESFTVEGMGVTAGAIRTDRNTDPIRSQKRYRVQSSENWVDWNGNATLAVVPIHALANTEISIRSGRVELTQSWRLSANGWVPNELLLAVPKDWTSHAKDPKDIIEVYLNSQAAVISKPNDTPSQQQSNLSPSAYDRYDWLRIAIAQDPISTSGPLQNKTLTLRKKWALSESSGNLKSFDWALPFLKSLSEKSPLYLDNYDGEIHVDPNTVCHLNFPEKVDSETNVRSTVYFDCTLTDPRLQGALGVRPEKPPIDVVVDSMWLQTMRNALEQRDRYVIKFSSSATYISLLLPADQLDDCRVILNGQKPKYSVNPTAVGRLDIEINAMDSDQSEPSEFVLEVFTWPKPVKEWIRSLKATPPRIMNASQHFSMIWQVILPSTEHLVVTSAGLSPSYRWRWKDLWFERQSEWTQGLLEKKFEATTQPVIAQQTNTYVLHALDQSSDLRVWIAPRYVLWVPVATLLLIGAFSILEFRWIQKPWLGIAIILLGFAFSQFAWDLSIALVQCLVASMGIAMVYVALQWILDRRSRRRSVFSNRSGAAPVPAPFRDTQPGSSVVSASNPSALPAAGTLNQTTTGNERRDGSSTNIHSLSNLK